jgi:two-component system OmpR family response regulator/two-component system response regulator QseB
MRLLLVEDDLSLGETMVSWLRLDQHAVDWVQRGDFAELALGTHQYDCVLLDRGLPGLSGDALLTRVRGRQNPVPVVMITAYNALADRVAGLDLGADDYLVKPFDLSELSARVRAAVRRNRPQRDSVLRHADIELDVASKQVCQRGMPVELTAREFAVLAALLMRRSQVVPRAVLEDALYGWGDEIESNAVEVYVHHLRRKLGRTLILTIRGLGYRLHDDHEQFH